jgi:hypothetical protein
MENLILGTLVLGFAVPMVILVWCCVISVIMEMFE